MRLTTVFTVLVCVSACDPTPSESTDGSVRVDTSARECTSDLDCDDGLFCTGSARCSPGDPAADARGCVEAARPCVGSESCDESTDVCLPDCQDMDGDGHQAASCGGDDCDDADERRYPGNIELCDIDGLDEDCDPATIGDDADADRYVSERCCQVLPTGRTECGSDCNDSSAAINPEAVDNCGGGDQDCDGVTDENADVTFYRDVDGDGHGILTDTVVACSAPSGYAVMAGDCDDARSGVNPGVPEVCNLRDDNCDGTIDEGCACSPDGLSDACGESDVGACRLGTRTCVAGAWSSCAGAVGPASEICEGSGDENCDGNVDEGCDCINGSTRLCGMMLGVCRSVMQVCSAGRWPRDCSAEPGVVGPRSETCDGLLDEDCDGATDEGCACTNGSVDRTACGSDTGECVRGMRSCSAGMWGSCSGGVGPATESCDGSRDEDCDGAIDEGCTCTNGTTRPCGIGECAGTQTCSAGAWGSCSGSAPSTEICNGLDDDCDGRPDSSDPDTSMVGTACGTSVGLCTVGAYSCPGTSLVCSGVAATTEVCDHRDQDCDGLLDDGVGAASCTWSAVAATGTAFRNEFQCSHASSCGFNAQGEIDDLAAGSSSAPRIASLRVTSGEMSPDWGERFAVSANFDVRALLGSGASTQGPVGVFISPSVTPSAGSSTTQGLPLLSGTQGGFAALYQTNYFLHWIEIWEMTPTGNVRRSLGSALSSSCWNDDTTYRRYTVRLESNGGTITASVTAPGCSTSTATYVDADWQSRIYGDDESLPFPRYQVGAVVWNADNMLAQLQAFSVARTASSSRPNCSGCPW